MYLVLSFETFKAAMTTIPLEVFRDYVLFGRCLRCHVFVVHECILFKGSRSNGLLVLEKGVNISMYVSRVLHFSHKYRGRVIFKSLLSLRRPWLFPSLGPPPGSHTTLGTSSAFPPHRNLYRPFCHVIVGSHNAEKITYGVSVSRMNHATKKSRLLICKWPFSNDLKNI